MPFYETVTTAGYMSVMMFKSQVQIHREMLLVEYIETANRLT